MKRWSYAVAVSAIAVGAAGCVDDTLTEPRVCTATGDCEEAVPLEPALHLTTPIDYPDPPPAGGPHNACWTTYGVHSTEVEDDNWVHNLEHGGVVFLYHCPSGCDAEVATLASLVTGRPFAVVSRYSPMPEGFAAVAWGHRLVTDTLDVDAFELFYATHVDEAPESTSAAPPASCVVAP